MLVTPFKLYQIPQPYRSRVGRVTTRVSELKCEEGLAWLRGEGASASLVRGFLQRVDEFTYEDVKAPSLPDDDSIMITATDDKCEWSKASLRRRFHFFDDFFSDFPNEIPNIPYTCDVLMDVLYHSSTMEEGLECMRFLNPKSNLEYLCLSTYGVNKDVLLPLIEQLTDEEKMDIMKSMRWRNPEIVVPCEGTDLAILACVLYYYNDYDTAKVLFSDYPSYLYDVCDGVDDMHQLLLTADFSREWCDRKTKVTKSIINILSEVDTQEEARRLLTMIEIVSPLFKNENDFAVLPYNEVPDTKLLFHSMHTDVDDVVNNLATVYGLDHDVVANELYRFK